MYITSMSTYSKPFMVGTFGCVLNLHMTCKVVRSFIRVRGKCV